MSEPAMLPVGERYAALRRQALPRRWLTAGAVASVAGLLAVLILDRTHHAAAAGLVVLVVAMAWDHRHGWLMELWPGDPGLHRLAATAAYLDRRGWVVLPAPSGFVAVGAGGVLVVEHYVRGDGRPLPVAERGVVSPVDNGLLRRIRAVCLRATAITDAVSGAAPRPVPVHPVITVGDPSIDPPRSVCGVTVAAPRCLPRLARRSAPRLSQAQVRTVLDRTREVVQIR